MQLSYIFYTSEKRDYLVSIDFGLKFGLGIALSLYDNWAGLSVLIGPFTLGLGAQPIGS